MTALIPKDFTLDIFNDLYFKNLFCDDIFKSIIESKIEYPCDVKNTKDGLEIDVAAIGLEKSDINIDIKDDVLTISYNKKSKNDYSQYAHHGITKRSFNLAWRISNKYDLSKTTASLDKGLLTVKIPFTSEKKSKQLTVNID